MMEQLDLTRHTPDEFAGKSVTITGRDYTIGPRFKKSTEGYAHFLVNDLSGLCVHLVQIRPEYQSNPAAALAASREKARETAALRTDMLRKGEALTIPLMSVIEGNGGSFELHETLWGQFGHKKEDSLEREAFDLAVSLSEAGSKHAAANGLKALLERHPNHALALALLAGVVSELNDQPSARQMFARAIEIEPNYAKLRGQQIVIAFNATRRREALELFQELKARYPLLDDYDGFGIHAYLVCGEPRLALDLLQQNTLPKQDAEQLLVLITNAHEVKQQMEKLGDAVEKSQINEADLCELLGELHKVYPSDPMIQANLGSALYRAGQYQRAAELLLAAGGGIADGLTPYCGVNLAFALLKISAWEPAMEMLTDLMNEVSSKAARGAAVSPSEVPGLGHWFAEKGVLKSKQLSSYQILAAAMTACPNPALIPRQVRQLAEIYRQAEGLCGVDGKVASPCAVRGSVTPSEPERARIVTAPEPAIAAGPSSPPPANPPASTTIPTTTSASLANPSVAAPEAVAESIGNEVPMAAVHFEHTATLLPSGKVLVAGGYGIDGCALSAELYDPSCNAWSAAGSLATGREKHTATLLPSGKVLVAGGQDKASKLSSAELYDPSSNTWSSAGSLETPRAYHTATLLPGGKVLVAGGRSRGSGSYASSAELYDPSSNTWSVAGALATPRSHHTATLLPGGMVLVAGGTRVGKDLSSTELYDPSSNTWSAAGPLLQVRSSHTATLLPSGKVLVAGGESRSRVVASAELYDPSSNTWSATGSLATVHADHTATLLASGKVLVAGGRGNLRYLFSAELYDPSSNTWSSADRLATGREMYTATLLPSGKVLVAGGQGFSGDLSSAELYDPSSNTWSTRW
jgi:N-acetylneuraminic acid mutarotase/tetratricopeptide (TPR) repeat protein